MSRCYSFFVQLHEGLQNTILQQVTSGIKTIVDDFAPPKGDDQTLNYMSGAFVIAGAMAGPLWEVASPLNAMAGVSKRYVQLGNGFTIIREAIARHVMSIFTGFTWRSLVGGPVMGAAMVYDAFTGGKWLDSRRVNDAASKLIQAYEDVLIKSLIVNAIKRDGWIVFIDTSRKNKSESRKITGAEWIENECFTLATRGLASIGRDRVSVELTVRFMEKGKIEKLSDPNRP
ncbi:hypothetical protein AJ80_00112 [Polytolypa hystricis UAMH7299]|uniref:Uncharacterized protein n=1 Tax=Polytolypa hystricis (strain UAMH7299) TaxID=1447883 RepID=A0A2B7Z5B1_POLH7|nr:hypothetical protein AJ80_00112 [Polytolypa hystricis UAMH7299]